MSAGPLPSYALRRNGPMLSSPAPRIAMLTGSGTGAAIVVALNVTALFLPSWLEKSYVPGVLSNPVSVANPFASTSRNLPDCCSDTMLVIWNVVVFPPMVAEYTVTGDVKPT